MQTCHPNIIPSNCYTGADSGEFLTFSTVLAIFRASIGVLRRLFVLYIADGRGRKAAWGRIGGPGPRHANEGIMGGIACVCAKWRSFVQVCVCVCFEPFCAFLCVFPTKLASNKAKICAETREKLIQHSGSYGDNPRQIGQVTKWSMCWAMLALTFRCLSFGHWFSQYPLVSASAAGGGFKQVIFPPYPPMRFSKPAQRFIILNGGGPFEPPMEP